MQLEKYVSTDLFTYLSVEMKYGTEGMESSGVLPEFHGIAVHDCRTPIREAKNDFPELDYSIAEINCNDCSSEQIRLRSIGEITGINTLAPSKPLKFTSDNLVVVFGSNGTGKLGYVRLLKHVCGATIPGPLHSNIFSNVNKPICAIITYETDDEEKQII